MNVLSRRLKRCRVEAFVDFVTIPRKFDWKVIDISPDGCKIEGNLGLKVGECVQMNLVLPGSDVNIKISSTCVWNLDKYYGFRFCDSPEGSKLKIACAIYGIQEVSL